MRICIVHGTFNLKGCIKSLLVLWNTWSSYQVWVLQDALFRLEPYVGKRTCAVLRGARSLVTGLWGGNATRLLDLRVGFFDFSLFPSEGKKSKTPTTFCLSQFLQKKVVRIYEWVVYKFCCLKCHVQKLRQPSFLRHAKRHKKTAVICHSACYLFNYEINAIWLLEFK